MDSKNKIYKASDASLNLSTTRLQKKRELLKHLSTISRHTQKPYVREKLLSIKKAAIQLSYNPNKVLAYFFFSG